MNKKKFILSIIFFIVLIVVTFYVIFSNCDFKDIVSSLELLKPCYLIIIFFIMILYFLLQGIYMKTVFNSLNVKNFKIKSGMFYAAAEFFFNAITPGASGGQPFAIYFMDKNGISIKKSMLVILLNIIIFKLYLIVGALLILIFKSSLIFENGVVISICFLLGFIIDCIVVTFYYNLMFNQKLVKLLSKPVINVYDKIAHKNLDVDIELEMYHNESLYIKEHKKEVLVGIIISFLQKTLLFSVLFVIYKAFGLSGYSYFDLLLLQIFVQICVEAILLPGGTGISEYVSSYAFVTIFGAISTTVMLLFRTLTFYIPILVIMFVVLIFLKKHFKKEN